MKSLLELFWIFFKLGLFTFGGGYAMIPQIKEIIVEKKKWLTDDEMLEIIAIAESTPGPIAVNMATYIGYLRKKFWGSFFATLGVVLPSFIIILLYPSSHSITHSSFTPIGNINCISPSLSIST